jgi:hypothetical protein
MRVSVITPVYNAADHVREAVESALAQPETAEVILVEDGSPDDSLAVCQELAAEHPTVHLHRHPNGENRGAGASRNLAILKSTCEHIAFLDADDFFLPGRFAVARELFEVNREIDGLYEAIATHVENEDGLQRWHEAGLPLQELLTMTQQTPPEQLFTALVKGGVGVFSIDGLVVNRRIFARTGLFDEHLRQKQDTAMIIKMAAVGRLVSGRLEEPVAMRRIHERNRMSMPRPKSEVDKEWVLLWHTLWRWSLTRLEKQQQQKLLDRLLGAAGNHSINRSLPTWMQRLQKRAYLVMLLHRYPMLIRERTFWRRLLPHVGFWIHRSYGRL